MVYRFSTQYLKFVKYFVYSFFIYSLLLVALTIFEFVNLFVEDFDDENIYLFLIPIKFLALNGIELWVLRLMRN